MVARSHGELPCPHRWWPLGWRLARLALRRKSWNVLGELLKDAKARRLELERLWAAKQSSATAATSSTAPPPASGLAGPSVVVFNVQQLN
eukprot:14191663-Alexandrium_andersonii.AAC.1